MNALYPEFTPIKTRMVDGVFIVSTRNLNLLFLNETAKSFCGYADGTNSFAQIIDLLLKEYDVPRDFNDGVYLKNNDLSYSVSQNEFLINSESLGYVYDVLLNEDSAILKVKLIPKRVYRKDYRNLIENSTIRKKLYTSF